MSLKWNDFASIAFAAAFLGLEAVILLAATAWAVASILDLPLPVVRGAVLAGCICGLGAAGLFARYAIRNRLVSAEPPPGAGPEAFRADDAPSPALSGAPRQGERSAMPGPGSAPIR